MHPGRNNAGNAVIAGNAGNARERRVGVWACRRVGVWAYGRMGVWAYGRMGVWAYGREWRLRHVVR